MGNFYTNVSLRTSERSAVIRHMREQGRACFVSQTNSGCTVVYDRRCEEQDVNDLEALTLELSGTLHCAALAVLNHDDDVLWMGLAQNGRWVTTYDSSQSFSGSAIQIALTFKVLGLLPLLWLLMRSPFMLFEMWRHTAIAWALGLPNFSVGLGYHYLAQGERPSSGSADLFENVT